MNGAAAPLNNLSLVVNNAAASVNLNVSQHLAQVTASAGLIKLAPGASSGARVIDSTGVLATGGRLDITNNRLIVDYAPGNSPIVSIRQQLASGYNAAGTLWAGNGIVSSTAAADPTSGIGYGEASDLVGPGGGTFGTEPVDASTVVARFTRFGDATLDGIVDFNDLVKLAQNYNTVDGARLWSQGDFTYDGNVDFNDLVKLAQNYNVTLPAGAIPDATPSFSADLTAAFALAPEPGTGALLGLLSAFGLTRRTRRRRRRR
jgi:hypothetical protein